MQPALRAGNAPLHPGNERCLDIQSDLSLYEALQPYPRRFIDAVSRLEVQLWQERPMQSKDLIRENLSKSADRVLAHVEDMRELALVFPSPEGGCHTLWVLGHLAYIEGQVIYGFMLGQPNPLADWEQPFDVAEPTGDASAYPKFDEVLAKCRDIRQSTLELLDSFSEEDLDMTSAHVPSGWEETFGTLRRCFQFVADHWYMHRGNLADARRAARLPRMWV